MTQREDLIFKPYLINKILKIKMHEDVILSATSEFYFIDFLAFQNILFSSVFRTTTRFSTLWSVRRCSATWTSHRPRTK